ncbi:rhomboid family-domain-containing protein [Radiomyces spectabilis]|uniref:rhomboid family-domain-containing protein n=1 Tax=Radiomyces spectabilis TaxID=64574 RepID=UPI0022205BD3|nr:rhomboid family-domain-containing protein [Radiomyces spectabilis]KAI8388055.1 rhomboid family-domain-containing protein [Radiomyces spectabilis]
MAGVPLPYGHKRRLPMRILLGPYKRPWFSWLSGAVMLIVLVVELVKNSSMTGSVIETSPFNVMIGPSFQVLINMGARYTPCMRPLPGYSPSTSVTDCYRDGETCTLEQLCGFGGFGGGEPNQSLRFFAPIFLHAGVIHYLMNMLTHLRLGADLECALGAPRYILLYLASGIWGFVLSAMLSPKNTASMGCSGALFGLIGYMFIDVIVNWRIIPNPMRELVKLLLATIISLVLGLLPGLDNFAHIGGFAVGIVMGMLVAPMRPSASKRAKWVTWGLRACALVILIIMFAVGINSFYSSPDPSQICPGCKYLSCLPVSNWCDNY